MTSTEVCPVVDDGTFDVRIEPGTPEAAWANGLAMELLTARVSASGTDDLAAPEFEVFVQSVLAALQEVYRDTTVERESFARIAYLLFAFSRLASLTLGMAASLSQGSSNPIDIDQLLPVVAQAQQGDSL